MTYPHLRPDELRTSTPGRTPGVVVTVPQKGRYFFPGGTSSGPGGKIEYLGLLLARDAFTSGELEHPDTRIEYGFIESDGKAWTVEKKLKVPATALPSPVSEASQGWG